MIEFLSNTGLWRAINEAYPDKYPRARGTTSPFLPNDTVAKEGRAPGCSSYNTAMAISYLDRLLEPLTDVLTPEVATALLELRADGELQSHIEELRRKANEGTLTRAEDAEYKDFVEAVDVISIIQAKARRFLERQSA